MVALRGSGTGLAIREALPKTDGQRQPYDALGAWGPHCVVADILSHVPQVAAWVTWEANSTCSRLPFTKLLLLHEQVSRIAAAVFM